MNLRRKPAGFVAETLEAITLSTWPKELPRDYVSASQLKMFARCPEQFRRHYVLGENERPSKAILWGTADHAAHEVNFKQKIYSAEDVSVDVVQDAFRDSLVKRIDEEGGADEVDWTRNGRLTGDDLKAEVADVKDKGTALVACYHNTVSPAILPTAVEEEFLIPPERLGLPVTIKGRIDLKARVPEIPGSFSYVPRIIERKTSAAKKKPGPEYIFAARVYQLADPCEVDIQFSIKTKSPNVEAFVHVQPVLPERMVLAEVRRVMLGIAQAYALYGPEQPWQGVFAGFSDTCGYCGFKETCPWWNADAWR